MLNLMLNINTRVSQNRGENQMQVFLSREVAQYVSNIWQNIGINAQDVCYKENYFYFDLFVRLILQAASPTVCAKKKRRGI